MFIRLGHAIDSIGAKLVALDTGQPIETTNEEISSLIDTWISWRDLEVKGERNSGFQIIQSRGMAHSNQIREFLLGRRGVEWMKIVELRAEFELEEAEDRQILEQDATITKTSASNRNALARLRRADELSPTP